MSRSSNDDFKELQYDVHQLGQEMIVGRRIDSDDSMKDIVNDAEKKIEQLVYEFVYHLASPATEESKEYSYYCDLLSRDDEFMRMVDKIHEDRHKGFEIGYKKLRNYS
jgi:hypothetical protein